MHRAGRREDAILFVGSLFSADDVFSAAEQALRETFGTVLFKSPTIQWDYSEYYTRELKPPILRNFLFFEAVVDPPCLVETKLAVMEMEKKFSINGRRLINLDPGYLTLAKTVLASKKNYSHRINLGKGIFAELELFFSHGRFNPMPYTYADYRDKRFLGFFTTARELFKKSLVAEKKTP
jgi:hypothetical protein